MQYNRVDNEPAFPVEGGARSYIGMTLRDYFAAKAMHAEIVTTASDVTPDAMQALVDSAAKYGRTIEQHVAWNAYRMADAMLAERSK